MQVLNKLLITSILLFSIKPTSKIYLYHFSDDESVFHSV